MMKIIKKPISITLYTSERVMKDGRFASGYFISLCFANDFVQINKTAYECKHSTLFH